MGLGKPDQAWFGSKTAIFGVMSLCNGLQFYVVPLYLLSCSYRTLFAIHWFYLNLGCPFLAGFSLLCSLILTNYCVANIVHVHWWHSLVGIKYFWFDFLILIHACINTHMYRYTYIHTCMHDYRPTWYKQVPIILYTTANEKMVLIGRLIVKNLLNDLVRLQHNSCFTHPASS